MAEEKEYKTLYDLLDAIASLPEYLRKDAVRKVSAVWRSENPFVEDVLKGRTTFTKEVKPLAEENCRLKPFSFKGGICDSPEFEAIAKDAKEKFAGILALGSGADDLTARTNIKLFSKRNILYNFLFFVPLAVFCLLFVSVIGKDMADLRSYWQLALTGGIIFSAIISILEILLKYPEYLVRRRLFARRILERAEFPDRTLGAR